MEDRSSSEGRLCALPATLTVDSGSLVDSVGFDLIGSDLGKDVESALQVALAAGRFSQTEPNLFLSFDKRSLLPSATLSHTREAGCSKSSC